MPLRAKFYIALICLTGTWIMFHAALAWHCDDSVRFLCYLAVVLVVSGLKVNLPGIKGTMSVNFLFILIGISELSLGETMVMGCVGTLIQCVWKPKKRVAVIRVLFSVANMALAVAGSYSFHDTVLAQNKPILLLLAALVFFFLNTAPIAAVISLTEGKRLAHTWRDCYFWSFPFYVGGRFHRLDSEPGHARGALAGGPSS